MILLWPRRSWWSGSRKRGSFAVLFGLVLLLSPLLADEAGAQATRPELVRLNFEGNDTFSDRALSNAIITRPTACRSFVLQPLCWAGADFAIDPSFLHPRVLRDDHARVLLYYYQRGFREAQVDTVVNRREGERAELTFSIREGVPVRVESLIVTGLEELEDPSLGLDLPVSEGDPLNLITLDAARDTLAKRLRNRGYAQVDVLRHLFIPSTDPFAAEVEFDVYAGPQARFGPIEVVGNEKIAESVVLRMLPFQEGDLYSEDLIFSGQRNLFNLDIFRHASIAQDLEHEPDSIVPLRVQVNEGHSHRVRAGAGWTTAECFNTDNRWSSRNFMGGARRLVVRGRVSNLFTSSLRDQLCPQAGTGPYGDVNWSLSADFTQPWIFSPRNSFSASVFAERQSLQDVFVREALGLNLGLTRGLGRGTSVTVSYRPQVARLDAAEIFFCTSFLICDPQDIDALQATNRLFPLGLSYVRDRTNIALAPTAGYTLLFDFEHSSEWTGSEFTHNRVIAEGTSFYELRPDVVLATRLRGGWLDTGRFQGDVSRLSGLRIAHPQKRFFSGGSNSVRGFAQNQIGPRVLTVGVDRLLQTVDEEGAPICGPVEILATTCDASAISDRNFLARPTGGNAVVEGSAELRFPLASPLLRGAAFFDFGQVWPEAGGMNLRDLELSPGLGVRYMTPIGPIRVDVGYRLGGAQSLQVITSQIEPFDPTRHRTEDQLRGPDDEPLGFVLSEELALLGPTVRFDEGTGFALGRFQLHLSIGHAF